MFCNMFPTDVLPSEPNPNVGSPFKFNSLSVAAPLRNTRNKMHTTKIDIWTKLTGEH